MSTFTAKVDGVAQLQGALSTVVERLDLADAHDRASDLIAERARRDAPKRTGYLAGTINSVSGPGIGTVVVTAAYAVPVQAAQPFLAPRQVVDQVVELYADELDDIVQSIQ